MLFALPVLLTLSILLPNVCGNELTSEKYIETPNTSETHILPTTNRRNQTKITRDDQLLNLLAARRRQIIQNRFKNHLRKIVEISERPNVSTVPTSILNFPNNSRTLNVHLNLSDLLQNAVVNISGEQTSLSNPKPEANTVNVSAARHAHKASKNNGGMHRETPQVQENKNISKTANMPIIRNILYRRKMSVLNRKLPLDFEQIAFDTLGISEISKHPEDLILDSEDSLQVEESSHDKLIYYDVKNNASKKSGNNFEDSSDEIKSMSMNNKTFHSPKIEKETTTETIETVTVSNETTPLKNLTELSSQNNTDLKPPGKNNTHFMSPSLYSYFRPLDVPEEEMQPFLRFGEKLLNSRQTLPPNQSTKTPMVNEKMKVEDEDNMATVKNEDEVHENMDVTEVKPIIENKITKMNLPNQKVNAARDYFKNRAQNKHSQKNLTEDTTVSKLDKNKIHMQPQLRNITQNRGFRNRTIFFQHKRNGQRQTINLRPNLTISDLRPSITTTTERVITTTVTQSPQPVTSATSPQSVTEISEIKTTSILTEVLKSNQTLDDGIVIKLENIQMNDNKTDKLKRNETDLPKEIVTTQIPEIETLKFSTAKIDIVPKTFDLNNITTSTINPIATTTEVFRTENKTDLPHMKQPQSTTSSRVTTQATSKLPRTTSHPRITTQTPRIPTTLKQTKITSPPMSTSHTTRSSTTKLPQATSNHPKMSVQTTKAPTTPKQVETTTATIPTTRVLSTAVVTSVSIESSISQLTNKTDGFSPTKKDHSTTDQDQIRNDPIKTTTDQNDPDATLVAALSNYTSQSFQNQTKYPKFNTENTKNVSIPQMTNRTKFILRPHKKILEVSTTPDFIINVPDLEVTTTELPSEPTITPVTTTTTTVVVVTPELDHPKANTVKIISRINYHDVPEAKVTTTVLVTTALPTTESVPPTTESVTTAVSTRQPSRIFNTTVLTTPDRELELPLATLFSVTDFKKPSTAEYNTTMYKSPGSETVISRKNENDMSLDNVHAAYILAALGFLPMMVIVIYVVRSVMKRKNKIIEDFEAELHDSEKKTIINPVARLPTLVLDSSNRWEFPRSKLRLQTLLGQGNFGQVWKAEADDIKGHIGLTRLVAVKTIKDGAGSKERDELLKELAIMQKMGSHPNVVTLLGCCTDKEPYLLIMEYVMYGKLLTFLRDHRTRQDYYNFSDDAAMLTARDLTVFAYCVARGMEYLSSKGIIHRDLAARNILVDHNKLCKIADFGMSRDVGAAREVTEPRQPRNALPVRWMAVESLLYSVFTHKSDVWSFGVLLWEIVTLGSSPYANMSGREVMRLVCDGYRLERPGHCRPELYTVMARTWAADPEQRPSFAELRAALADMLDTADTRDGSYVDLESFRADPTVYEIDNCTPRGNYFTVHSRYSEFECDI